MAKLQGNLIQGFPDVNDLRIGHGNAERPCRPSEHEDFGDLSQLQHKLTTTGCRHGKHKDGN